MWCRLPLQKTTSKLSSANGMRSASPVTTRAPGTYCSLTLSIAWLMSKPIARGCFSTSSARKNPVPQPMSSSSSAPAGTCEIISACQSCWNRRENLKPYR
jgi:hypothetical protein